jgi:hypothetical protein
MPLFTVKVTRYQTQSETFVLNAKNKEELEIKLNDFDFGEIDHRFDEAEVDSIEYEINDAKPCANQTTRFADEELQQLIN